MTNLNPPFSKSVNDAIIVKKLLSAADEFFIDKCKLKLGDKVSTSIDGETLTFKIWGFTRDYSNVVTEVIINDVPVTKLVLKKKNNTFECARCPRFVSDYKRLSGVAA